MDDPIEFHLQTKGKLEIKSKVSVNNKKDLSLAYTPGVAKVSEAIAKDKDLAYKLTSKWNSIAIISDGTAVLGLGDIGPEAALAVMEGKAVLFKEFGNVDAIPLCLATKDTEEIIKTVKYISPVFGGINLEDISAPRCFEIEDKLKEELDVPVFHDDQHGTAIVVLAGLINALKITNKDPKQIKVVINGAGAAGIALSKILINYNIKNLILLDSKGIITKNRDHVNPYKLEVVKKSSLQSSGGGLSEALVDADVFIGVSKANLVTKEMVRSMNRDPIIFAMANPIPEISPEDAYEAGASVVATGRSDYPNQINNVLAFPGIFRGLLDSKANQLTEEMKIEAAKTLANLVESPTKNKIIPEPFEKGIADAISDAIKSCVKE